MTLPHVCRESQKFKCIQNYGNELCKWYDIDTDETFMVTGLNDKPPELSQHLFKMSTLRLHGRPIYHTNTKTATRFFLQCFDTVGGSLDP